MVEPAKKKSRFAEVNDMDLAKVVENEWKNDAVPKNTKASTSF